MNMLAFLAFVLSLLAYLGEAKKCYGYRSCYNRAISSHNYCFGYQACMYARPVSKGHTSYCYGFQSCYGLKMTRSYQNSRVICGFYGCQSAKIYSSYAYAYGHLALYGATVHTYGAYGYGSFGFHSAHIRAIGKSLKVYLYGMHAGYNARVYCYAGDSCTVYCQNNACQHTYFYCYNHASCHLSVSTSSYPPSMYGGNGNKQLTDEQIETARKQNEEKISAAADEDKAKLSKLSGLAEAIPSVGKDVEGVEDLEVVEAEEENGLGLGLAKDNGMIDIAEDVGQDDLMVKVDDLDLDMGEDVNADMDMDMDMGFVAFETPIDDGNSNYSWSWATVAMLVCSALFLCLLFFCMYKNAGAVWRKVTGSKYQTFDAAANAQAVF